MLDRNTAVSLLLEKLASTHRPEFVFLQPESGFAEDDCFNNVKEKIRLSGGEIIYGWKIHMTPLLIEAEKHAVWKNSDEKLIDVTPDSKYEKGIAFVRQTSDWVYDRKFIEPVYLNISENELVYDLITSRRVIIALYSKSKRISQTEILLDEQTAQLIGVLNSHQRAFEQWILNGNSLQSKCFCTSSIA